MISASKKCNWFCIISGDSNAFDKIVAENIEAVGAFIDELKLEKTVKCVQILLKAKEIRLRCLKKVTFFVNEIES